MKPFHNLFKNRNWKHLSHKLVLENCLILGLNPRSTSKKINKYLLGTRSTLDIFKLYELRYLLLKMYPLIHILFQNPRVNSQFELQPSKTELLPRKSFSFGKKEFPKKKVSFSFKHKNLPPQILFATTTEAFSDIIFKAAAICNMPCHKKRWINGSITAAISDRYNNDPWNFSQSAAHKQVSFYFNNYWSFNKENHEKIKEKTTLYGRSRWPSLMVIPDIANNSMILSEAQKIGLPVIGLVNSHCAFEIDYPIFAQDQSFSSVYFFCHFLSTLIAKEIAYSQHKNYTLQNIQSLQTNLVTQKQKKPFFSRMNSFQKLVLQQKMKKYLKKNFFSKKILPAQQQISQRNLRFAWLKTLRWRISNYSWFRNQKKIYKMLGWKPYFFSLPRSFKDIIYYFHKRGRFNFFLRSQFRKISTFHKRRFEKQESGPTNIFFFNESKKKYFLKSTQNILCGREKKHTTNNLLRNFLWLSKKAPLYWKYQLLESTKTFYANNNYFWWSLHHLISDLKWQQHEDVLPKFLHLIRKRKRFLQKNYQKYEANFVKKQKKSTWKKWVHKTKKNPPFKKKHNFFSRSKKTRLRY